MVEGKSRQNSRSQAYVSLDEKFGEDKTKKVED